MKDLDLDVHIVMIIMMTVVTTTILIGTQLKNIIVVMAEDIVVGTKDIVVGTEDITGEAEATYYN